MIATETDEHQRNGAHDETGAPGTASPSGGEQDRRVVRQTLLHPPMQSVAVWGPIAAVTFLAILVIFGA